MIDKIQRFETDQYRIPISPCFVASVFLIQIIPTIW